MEQHTGFIRLMYTFDLSGDHEFDEIKESLQALVNNDFDVTTDITFDLKGFVSHNKKNRTNVKVDYVKFNYVSHAFSTNNLLNSLSAMN